MSMTTFIILIYVLNILILLKMTKDDVDDGKDVKLTTFIFGIMISGLLVGMPYIYLMEKDFVLFKGKKNNLTKQNK